VNLKRVNSCHFCVDIDLLSHKFWKVHTGKIKSTFNLFC